MSYHVEALCDRRRFGSAARKQIAMYLANKASDDGAGIWCSKHTIARHTELSLATVKRTIRDFLDEGLLVETGERRPCDHGHTVVYRLVLEAVSELESLLPQKVSKETGVTVNPVHDDTPRGVTVTPRRGSPRPPNNPGNNPLKPPTRAEAREAAEVDLEKIWSAYPSDRRRDRKGCRRHLAEALGNASVEELAAAAAAYAAETDGYTRSKVCFLDNWLRLGKWRRHVDALRQQKATSSESAEKILRQVAGWVKTRHGMCRHLTSGQVTAALQRGLITRDEATAAGVLK